MKGFIGFFDILGYKSFLENSTSLETAESIIKRIAEAGRETQLALTNLFDATKTPSLSFTLPDWLVFSDTIVFTLPVDDVLGSEVGSVKYLFSVYQRFIISAIAAETLQRNLFYFGLPLRGALHYGEFIRHENCLAGRGILEAYNLIGSNLACCIVTDVALSNFTQLERISAHVLKRADGFEGRTNLISIRENMNMKLIKYSVPYSNGIHQAHTLINWMKQDMFPLINMEEFVRKSFFAHNKTSGPRVEEKLLNTVAFLRFLESQQGRFLLNSRGKESI